MLEDTLATLAKAVERLAAAVEASNAPAKPETAAAPAKPAAPKPAAPKPAAPKPAAAPAPMAEVAGAPLAGPTQDQLRDQLRALLDAKGKDAVVAALAAVGAAKLSDVTQADYQRLADAVKQQAEAQADPFA